MSGDCQFPEQCGFPDCICTGMIFDVEKFCEGAKEPEYTDDGVLIADPDDFDDLEPFGEDVGEEVVDEGHIIIENDKLILQGDDDSFLTINNMDLSDVEPWGSHDEHFYKEGNDDEA